jgi:hypothetical protein
MEVETAKAVMGMALAMEMETTGIRINRRTRIQTTVTATVIDSNNW